MSDSERMDSSEPADSDQDPDSGITHWVCKKCPGRIFKTLRGMEKHRAYHKKKPRPSRKKKHHTTPLPPAPQSESTVLFVRPQKKKQGVGPVPPGGSISPRSRNQRARQLHIEGSIIAASDTSTISSG